MSEEIEPTAEAAEIIRPPSHERILWIMAILGIAGGIAGFAFGSLEFGLGILVGTALAFVNYYWLSDRIRPVFPPHLADIQEITPCLLNFLAFLCKI